MKDPADAAVKSEIEAGEEGEALLDQMLPILKWWTLPIRKRKTQKKGVELVEFRMTVGNR
jgi:hypothetical protein